MKTILTTITFAIALMVFAFDANPAFATEESNKKVHEFLNPPSIGTGCVDPSTGAILEGTTNCDELFGELDDIDDPGAADNKRDVADSGEEGSTSAAGATEQ